MSSLTSIEKLKLEAFFQMSGGYVLDFVDRSFQGFFLDSVNIVIDLEKYRRFGTSKANRLRAFWFLENDILVGTLIEHMAVYWKEKKGISGGTFTESENILYEQCISIAKRLKEETSIDLQSFDFSIKDKTWKKVKEEIITCVQNNEHERGLDRLHTFMIFFFRDLNQRHAIIYSKDTPLHNLAGAYINYLRTNNLIESKMGENILRYGVKILDDFNDIRNNKSLSHANPVLNHEEALLIFSQITGLVRFIHSLEPDI